MLILDLTFTTFKVEFTRQIEEKILGLCGLLVAQTVESSLTRPSIVFYFEISNLYLFMFVKTKCLLSNVEKECKILLNNLIILDFCFENVFKQYLLDVFFFGLRSSFYKMSFII